MVINLENEEFFKKYIEEKKLSLVYFWSNGCPPCKMFAQKYEEISKNVKDVNMLKINTEEDSLVNVVINYGIKSVPTIIGFYNGIEIDREIGVPKNLFDSIDKYNIYIENL